MKLSDILKMGSTAASFIPGWGTAAGLVLGAGSQVAQMNERSSAPGNPPTGLASRNTDIVQNSLIQAGQVAQRNFDTMGGMSRAPSLMSLSKIPVTVNGQNIDMANRETTSQNPAKYYPGPTSPPVGLETQDTQGITDYLKHMIPQQPLAPNLPRLGVQKIDRGDQVGFIPEPALDKAPPLDINMNIDNNPNYTNIFNKAEEQQGGYRTPSLGIQKIGTNGGQIGNLDNVPMRSTEAPVVGGEVPGAIGNNVGSLSKIAGTYNAIGAGISGLAAVGSIISGLNAKEPDFAPYVKTPRVSLNKDTSDFENAAEAERDRRYQSGLRYMSDRGVDPTTASTSLYGLTNRNMSQTRAQAEALRRQTTNQEAQMNANISAQNAQGMNQWNRQKEQAILQNNMLQSNSISSGVNTLANLATGYGESRIQGKVYDKLYEQGQYDSLIRGQSLSYPYMNQGYYRNQGNYRR